MFGFLAVLVGFYSIPVAAGVGAVAAVYFYGLVEVVHFFRRLGGGDRERESEWPSVVVRQEGRLTKVASSLPAQASGVLVGRYLAVIDFACAFRLWVELLERFPDFAHPLTDKITDLQDTTWIVVGGPLSVPARRHLPAPLCELAPTDAVYSDWGYLTDGHVLCVDDHDDTVGCVAASSHKPDVIYVDGFRSVGVEAATQWVLNGLQHPQTIEGISWALVKYDASEGNKAVLSA